MKKLLRKIRNKAKKAVTQVKAWKPGSFGRTRYFWYRDHLELQGKEILLTASDSGCRAVVLEAMLQKLVADPEYKEYTIYLAAGKTMIVSWKDFVKRQKLKDRVNIVTMHSLHYYKVLAEAKYLVSDGDLTFAFTKRAGQIYLNVRPGYVQKTFFDADYVFCQRECEVKHIVKEYMLENFAKTKFWIPGDLCRENVQTDELAGALCQKLILGVAGQLLEERNVPYNGKKNVVIYMGGLGKNGLTTSGANLLNTIDRTKNNYAVFACMTGVQSNKESVREFPENVPWILYHDFRGLTLTELLQYMLWRGFGILSYARAEKLVKRLGTRNAERMLLNCRLDTVVQFTGYNDDMIAAIEQLPCNRVIFVHSDMEQEIRYRANINKGLLGHAYVAYNHVAVVTEAMIPPVRRIVDSENTEGSEKVNFALCQNVIDDKRILILGQQTLEFDDMTECYGAKEKLLEALTSGKKKFVSVGRFSIEKGHERLIHAFERFHKEQPDTCLVVIGGHGDLWDKTVRQVKESSCRDAVFLVRYMSNPFPLMKQCDCFVLTSLYEGFGLALAEADILGLPCFTVDIDGPKSFMERHGGTLVENSEDGIYEGLMMAMQGKLPLRLSVDYEEYNRQAVKQFEELL